jgi:hypothetical protein
MSISGGGGQLQYTPARWMQFVDGENLTIRSQEMLSKSGFTLKESRFTGRIAFLAS